MIIQGLQKITLLDFPGKVACTVFTRGCNFRCPFCQNALLVTDIDLSEFVSEEEFFDYLQKRTGVLDGVCVSGGEPLMNDDIEGFIKRIKDMGFSVKLDTNGSFPKRLKALIDAKLVDYVAMDVKSSLARYSEAAGIAVDIEKILESIEILKNSEIEREFRTTVTKELHDEETVCEIAKLLEGEKLFLQQYTVSDNMIGKEMTSFDQDGMKALQNAAKKILPDVSLRGI